MIRATPAYIGFTWGRNVGDQCAHRGAELALGRRLALVPRTHTAHRIVRLRPHSTRRGLLVLGGGTLIGRAGWIERVARTTALLQPAARVVFGTGVECAVDGRPSELSDAGEREAWIRWLTDADVVAVRGHHSAAMLASWGIPSIVVGDPAFYLRSVSAPLPQAKRADVAVMSISTHEVAWGGQPADKLAVYADLCHYLFERGLRVQLLVMDPKDLEPSLWLRELVPSGMLSIRNANGRLDLVISAIRKSSIAIGARLHLSIMAAALATPCVQFAYRPKSYDAMSVLAHDLPTIRNDLVDTTSVPAASQECSIIGRSIIAASWTMSTRYSRSDVVHSATFSAAGWIARQISGERDDHRPRCLCRYARERQSVIVERRIRSRGVPLGARDRKRMVQRRGSR